MLSLCLTIGIILIALAAILAVYVSRSDQSASISSRTSGAGNKKLARPQTLHACQADDLFAQDNDIQLNLDAFSDPDLAVPGMNNPFNPDEFVVIDDDDDDRIADSSPAVAQPSMTLASLMDAQIINRCDGNVVDLTNTAKPKILGDSARELGIRYFDFLIAHHVVPRGNRKLTSEANILVAQNALKTARQSATLSHGAVAQRIGERAICLFEPLDAPVSNIPKALDLLNEIFAAKTVFIVLANTDDVDPQCLLHLSPICKKFNIPKTCLYIEQQNGSFINYFEDVNDFVPDRIDPFCMPQNFFSNMLDYAHNAYDDGDLEAVLRTIEPFIEPITIRINTMQNFSKILLAQALNLLGMTKRDIGQDDDAIQYFEHSLEILRQIEDYEALKSVMANLGITLALSRPVTQQKIELAIRRLSEVTQLNPRDDEAWLYLANSYLELFRITSAQSLLKRALRAYDKAYELAPSDEIAACMDALERQIGSKSTRRRLPTLCEAQLKKEPPPSKSESNH